jgi:hypothetical protein
MKNLASKQRGMTLISFLIVFIVIGFFVMVGLKLSPIYLEHFKIKSSLEALRTEPGLAAKSTREIKAMLQKRWDINSITRITAEDSVFFEKKNGVLTISVAYEVVEPMMGNVSALVKFDDAIQAGDLN